MPDVHQRLYFYKRLAQAATDEDLEDARAEIVDRYGDLPEEAEALLELMAVKVRLRSLAIRGLDAGPGRLVFSLGPDASLDPFLLARHVQKSGGALRLTPDMKLVATLAPPPGAARAPKTVAVPSGSSPAGDVARGRDLLREARRVLSGLSGCARVP
jgi:transcription-repair coupling factor (superfamily II helicase)